MLHQVKLLSNLRFEPWKRVLFNILYNSLQIQCYFHEKYLSTDCKRNSWIGLRGRGIIATLLSFYTVYIVWNPVKIFFQRTFVHILSGQLSSDFIPHGEQWLSFNFKSSSHKINCRLTNFMHCPAHCQRCNESYVNKNMYKKRRLSRFNTRQEM